MSTYLRLAGILLLVAVAALVMLPCGAGEADACLHACCERPRSGVDLRGAVARLITALTSLTVDVDQLAAVLLDPVPARAAFAVVRMEVAPLRI